MNVQCQSASDLLGLQKGGLPTLELRAKTATFRLEFLIYIYTCNIKINIKQHLETKRLLNKLVTILEFHESTDNQETDAYLFFNAYGALLCALIERKTERELDRARTSVVSSQQHDKQHQVCEERTCLVHVQIWASA